MTDYLALAEVLAIHDDQIERYGGPPASATAACWKAALYRPQTGYYADLIEEAAALWESLAQNYSFIDGNKRTGFAATLPSTARASRPMPKRRMFHRRALRDQRFHL